LYQNYFKFEIIDIKLVQESVLEVSTRKIKIAKKERKENKREETASRIKPL
jgi:hypothetical protein